MLLSYPVASALAVLFQLWLAGVQADANHVERDVLIIGGGAAGTYTAIRLQQLGKSVALVEQQDRLGGHVNTYVDPVTGQTFDYGVIVFANISVVRNYFNYLEVPLAVFESWVPGAQTVYADFMTGAITPATVLFPGNATADLLTYLAQLKKYGSLTMATGYHIPDPVPEELMLPWGEFLAKYNITSVAYPQFYEAAANALQQLTLYMFKYFSQLSFMGAPLTSANRDNQALYNNALAKLDLSTNVFLQSNVTHVRRTKRGVVTTINTPSGRKLIRSRLLVIAIPPKLVNLEPFLDLRKEESNLLKEFTNIYIWSGVVANSGIPYQVGIDNVDPTGESGIPRIPAALAITQSGIPDVDVHAIYWGSTSPIADSDVQAGMRSTFNNIQQSMNYSAINGTTPELVEYHNHSPYLLTVSAEAIRNGFYTKLNALQGQYNTWWTGAAWDAQNSAAIWNFTEYQVLPGILDSLNRY